MNLESDQSISFVKVLNFQVLELGSLALDVRHVLVEANSVEHKVKMVLTFCDHQIVDGATAVVGHDAVFDGIVAQRGGVGDTHVLDERVAIFARDAVNG